MKQNLLFNQASAFGMRFIMVLTMLLIVGIGQAWGAETYNFSSIPTSGWKTAGGTQSINSKTWTYSSSTYIGVTSSKIQIGSKNDPQISDWTIQIPISSFDTNIKVTKVAITAYTTATTATYDISVGGSSVKSGNLTTSSATYSSSTLNATTGNIVVTLKGSSSSKAMYLSNISVTYETATSYTVNWTINPAAGGTLSATTGNSITVTPATGYTYGSPAYTVTSGTASVTQSGNTFTAAPTENSTIQINMVEKPKYTITLKDDNTTLTQSTAGGSVTLPTRDGCDGYTFAGWTKSWSVAQTTWTTTAPTIIPAGSYTPTANENLYPVYTKTEGGGTSYQFQQVTALSQIKAGGTFIITNGSYYLPNAQATNSGPAKANMVEVTDGVVTGSVTDDMKWTFSAADANGKITIKSAVNSSYYLYTTSDNNGLRVNATSDTWTFEEYTVSNVLGFAMKSTSQSRYCAVYTSGSNWRSYTTKNASNYGTNSGRLDLYKSIEVSSTTTSYISVPECSTETLVSVLPKIMNF